MRNRETHLLKRGLKKKFAKRIAGQAETRTGRTQDDKIEQNAVKRTLKIKGLATKGNWKNMKDYKHFSYRENVNEGSMGLRRLKRVADKTDPLSKKWLNTSRKEYYKTQDSSIRKGAKAKKVKARIEKNRGFQFYLKTGKDVNESNGSRDYQDIQATNAELRKANADDKSRSSDSQDRKYTINKPDLSVLNDPKVLRKWKSASKRLSQKNAKGLKKHIGQPERRTKSDLNFNSKAKGGSTLSLLKKSLKSKKS
jgi:hypothetical protein